MKRKNIRARLLQIVYKLRGKLIALPLVFAVFCTWHEYENHLWIWLPALAMFGAGLAVRLWAQQHIRFRLKFKKTFTTAGPYGFVRNPIYIANTAMCVALTIASELLWMIPVTLAVCCIVYSCTVKHEESILPDLFGQDYIDYKNQVPRWLPRIPETPSSLGWVNENFGKSLVAEAHTLIFLGAMVAKEIISR